MIKFLIGINELNDHLPMLNSFVPACPASSAISMTIVVTGLETTYTKTPLLVHMTNDFPWVIEIHNII